VSPKSRGRPKGRGRQPVRRGGAPVAFAARSLSAQALADAALLLPVRDVLEVEQWASSWLGAAWAAGGLGERDVDGALCRDVAARALARPSATSLAAVAALARVAPPSGRESLVDAVGRLSGTVVAPAWLDEPAHRPVRAWRAVDVWDSEHVLFVDLDGPTPHTVMAATRHVGGTVLDTLGLLRPGAAQTWATYRGDDEPPMPIAEAGIEDVLGELASVLELTDLTWPRPDDEGVIETRAVAWLYCRDHLARTDPVDLDETQEQELLTAFATRPDVAALDGEPESISYVASLCLDYGTGYMPTGHLCWSPAQVAYFLTDWLPRKTHLDAEDRQELPGVLRAWVRFALERRKVPEDWITPVVEAVDTCLPGFTDAVDDPSSWGPAKQLAARLEEMGVDLSDRAAVDGAIRSVNAENLARNLLDR
jgi:hypothetical protein